MTDKRNFFQTILDKCLGQKVNIILLFDYLKEIADFSAQQDTTLTYTFITKWRKCFENTVKKTAVVKLTGWIPNCLGPDELSKQKPWEAFVKKRYDPSFTEVEMISSEHSPEYQPLNFKELIYLSFWKELYQVFGNAVLSHIFEKSAFLYEVEEGLFLLVAYPGGEIYQNVVKFDDTFVRKPKRHIALANGTEQKYKNNPYEISTHFPNEKEFFLECDIIAEKVTKSDCNRKRKVIENDPLANNIAPPQKKRKLSEKQDNPAKSVGENCNKIKEKQDLLLRWLKPKPVDLEKLLEHRASLLTSITQLQNGKSSSSSSCKPDEATLSYIRIQKDEEFKPKDKLYVLKQTSKLSVKAPTLPTQWKGLQLENLENIIGEGKDSIRVNAYFISETLAKKLGIRVKPKGRCRNKRKHPNPTLDDPDPSSIPQIVSPKEPSNLPNDDIDHAVIPFQPNLTLPIASCLYNRSCWSSWPKDNVFSRAVLVYPTDKIMSVKIIAKSILDKAISSEPAYKSLLKAAKVSWPDPSKDMAFPLNKMLLDIMEKHVKFKNIHRLVKSCSIHWRTLYEGKQARKEKRKTIRLNKHRSASTAVVTKTPEIIDLTLPSSEALNHPPSVPMEVVDLEPSQPSIVVTLDSSPDVTFKQPNGTVANYSSDDVMTFVTAEEGLNKSTSDHFRQKTPQSQKLSTGLRVNNDKGKELKCIKQRNFKSLRNHIPFNCVTQTLKQVLHFLKLDKLLGSKRNIRGFFQFVRKSVMLAGTKSSLHLGELMAFLKVEETPFYQACGELKTAAETLLAKFVNWLFTDYVLVLLKISFYITECNDTRFHVKFFLRESWISASDKLKRDLVQKRGLSQMQEESQTQYQWNSKGLVRCIPKRNCTLRPLLIKKKGAWGTVEDNKMFLMLLRYIDSKINKSLRQLPVTFQNAWRNFLDQWRKMGCPKLYYLRMDIKDAYPSVSSEKLNELLVKIAGQKENRQHLLQKQFMVFNGSNKKAKSSIFDSYHRSNWHSGIQSRPCIVMDMNKDKKFDVGYALQKLTSLIGSSNIVKIGKKSFEFNYGLPQGWGLSSTLCSVFYGYMDSTLYLPFLDNYGRFFLRYVDDYLYVTPDANEVQNFLQIIKIGCDKYGIKMNEEKSETNIYVRSDRLAPEGTCEYTTFCGWNVCLVCGHISRSYQNYDGKDFCSTISFQMVKSIKSPEHFIRQRGTLIMPVRLKSILMDLSINCPKRVLLTTFEAAVLLGFRFYSIFKVVYPTMNAFKEPERANQVFESVKLCCRRLTNFVLKNCNNSSPIRLDSSFSNSLSCTKRLCCGVAKTSSVNLIQPDAETLPELTPLSLSGYEQERKNMLSYYPIMYATLLGIQMKFREHMGVFKDELLPLIGKLLIKIRNKLDQQQFEAISEIVGDEMPACFRNII